MPRKTKDLLDVLGDKMLVGDGCWEWTGTRDRRGYGAVAIHRKRRFAHRVVYELLVGPIPEGLVIDHLCRNPGCVRPAHLEPVTQAENVRRGVGFPGVNARKTHCINGHPLSGDNVYARKEDGQRGCRRCMYESGKHRYERNRGKPGRLTVRRREAKAVAELAEPTISVPEAARRLGLSRSEAYAEAHRYEDSQGAEGLIPVLPRTGKLFRVPIRLLKP